MIDDRIVLGVDGGGTRTRALLTHVSGEVVGRGGAGPSNPADVGPAAARASIIAAVDDAWRESGMSRTPVVAACIGIGGVRTPLDCTQLGLDAEGLCVAKGTPISLVNDLQVAHYAAFSEEAGVTLLVGTGSACFGRSVSGRGWRSGGWGSRLDDGGSGHDLGRRLIIASIRAFDGRAPETALSRSVVDLLQVDHISEIPGLVESGEIGRSAIASLAPLVFAAARDGDEVARSIVRGGVDELAQLIRAVVVELSDKECRPPKTVAAVGGLFDNKGYCCGELVSALGRLGLDLDVMPSSRTPVEGAAAMAAESLNHRPRFVLGAANNQTAEDIVPAAQSDPS